MMFTNPEALFLLLVLPIFWALAWRAWAFTPPAGRLLSVFLRTSIVSLIVASLAGPTISRQTSGTPVVFAVDQSASMSEEMRRDAQQWVQDALRSMGERDQAAIVTFGRDPRIERGLSDVREHTFTTDQLDDTSTSMERALRVSRSLLSDTGGRIVLVTDGGENVGNGSAEAYIAASQGIEVSSVFMRSDSTAPEAIVLALDAPSNVREGEDFDLTVSVSSTVKQPATLRLWMDNRSIGQEQVELQPGSTRFTIARPPQPPGYHSFRVSIEAPLDTQPGNNVAFATTIVRERPTVLVIESTEGAGQRVQQALSDSGITVERQLPNAIPSVLSSLRKYDSIILFDIPSSAMTLDQMKALEQYVQNLGRGLVAIGGGQAFGLGDYADTPLETALPVSMEVPPRDDKPSVALLLIIDKSGSMDYGSRDGPNKMAMAREAAVLALEELEATDQIGVLAFDDTNRWSVPFQVMGSGAQREAVISKIQSIQAGGGTEIFPALQTGYVELRKRTAQLRHIILLTDGKSFSGGDYDSLINRMRQDQITLSTLGIGNDTDEALLKSLASKGNGRYYLTTDATKIPQLMTKETKIASKNPIVESRFHAQLGEISPILRGFKPEDLPPLGGYVVTTPKPTAQRVLSSPTGDPVLSKWQYGLGRAVAWTPDASDRWAGEWLAWPGFPKFISQMVRWSMPDPANRPLQTSVAIDGEEAVISLDAAEEDGSYIDLADTTVTIVAADNSQRTLRLRQIAPGRYEGRIPAGPPGAYRLQITQQRQNRPPLQDIAGYSVPYPDELRPAPTSPASLIDLARASGGRLLTQPADAFTPMSFSRATVPSPIWPWLLLAAGLLLPLEIAARRGILTSLLRRGGWRRISFRST